MLPREYSLVRLDPEYKDWLLSQEQIESELLSEEVFIFLGEIPNMPTHCVVAGKKQGKILSGYHSENFVELSHEDL